MGAVGDEHAEIEEYSDYAIFHEVREALKKALSGDTDDFNQLVGNMYQDVNLAPDQVAMLETILKALAEAVFYIDVVQHRPLLSAICRMSLWNYGPGVMDALAALVVALAVSIGNYVDFCLDMLVSNFIPPYTFLEILKQPRGLAKKEQVLIRVHSALKGIADLVPLAPSRLEQIVRERMPNLYTKEAQIAVYVENMLMLESGDMGEVVGNSMIFELVHRLMELDVEIGWDEILLDDPNGKGIFEMELEDMARPVDETEMDMDMDEPQKDYSGRKVLWGNVVAQKLDTLMDLTFDHLHSCFKNDRLRQVFKVFLQSFESSVLNVRKSKFVQFVMFYACSLDPEVCGEQFVSRLLEIFGSTICPQYSRINAVAYLASYMSRAKFLSTNNVTVTLERMVDWCHAYCENQSGDINQKHHQVFYAGCQAVMYVLCFRMRSILATPGPKSQLFKMPLEQVLKHALNPLEVCLPSIVEEFMHQAKAACLFSSISNGGTYHSLEYRSFAGLDGFFPFDPYLLKKSDRFIRPNFIYWSMVKTTYDDDDEEDDDEVEGDDEFDMNLSKMSITPRGRDSFVFGNQHDTKMQMPSRIRPSTSPESL